MDRVIETIPQVPIEYYNKTIESTKKKSIIDHFLGEKSNIDMEIFIPSCILFVSLGTINIPLSFFYIALFITFSSYKNTNYELYQKFMISSILLFGYFVLLILCIYIINVSGGINLHPNGSERPYFYFM
jgi:hypothetical protein